MRKVEIPVVSLEAAVDCLEEAFGVIDMIRQELTAWHEQRERRATPHQLAVTLGLVYEALDQNCWERLKKLAREPEIK